MSKQFMSLKEAIKTVYELANQNCLFNDNSTEDLKADGLLAEANRQQKALDIFAEFMLNQYNLDLS